MVALLCVLTCLALFILCGAQSGKKSGLYNVTVISIGPCADVGTNEVIFHTRLSKPERDAVCYSGWLSLPYGLTDEMNEIWEISSKGSTGGWKSNFLTFRNKHACSDTTRLHPQWFELLKNANLSDTSCPIPKGNYSFTCIDLRDVQFERTSVMIYGTYRVTIKYYLNKVKIRCTEYVGTVYPRVNSTVTKETSKSSLVSRDLTSSTSGRTLLLPFWNWRLQESNKYSAGLGS